MSDWYIGQVREHSASFMGVVDIIRTEVTASLWAIEQALERGQTKEEIVDEWNEVFECEESKFKDYDEIIEWLENVGI